MTEVEIRQQEIRMTFASFTDPDDKWGFILKLARAHEGMDSSLKSEKFLVQGCAATMYLVPSFENGKVHFFMDTDGGLENPLISRGLGVLALKVYNGLTPAEILSVNPEFFQEIGLTVALSATRANGFASLIKQIYLYARVYGAIASK